MNVCTRHPAGAEPKLTIWTLFVTILCLLLPVTSHAASAPLRLEVKNTLTSYYGSKLDGSKTATGQRHDSEGLMAAHRNLPFGTVLRVTNLSNGRDVLVRINDRGPFSPRLGLDISQAAARELNIIRAGVAKVQTEVVSDAKGRSVLPGSDFYVDLGTVPGSAPQSQVDSDLAEMNAVRVKANSALPAVRVLSKALPDTKGRRFLGMGPFTSFLDAEKAFKTMKKHWPRTKVICAAMAPENTKRFVASVVADDVPKVVKDYKGKVTSKREGKNTNRRDKNKNKRSRNRAEQNTSIADKDAGKSASKTAAQRAAVSRQSSEKQTVASKAPERTSRSDAKATGHTSKSEAKATGRTSKSEAKAAQQRKNRVASRNSAPAKTATVTPASSTKKRTAARSATNSGVRTASADQKTPNSTKNTTRSSKRSARTGAVASTSFAQ